MNLIKKINNNRKRRVIKRKYDNFIYVVVFIAPIANIPQLYSIWNTKDASGVSALSWLFFALISLSWLFYGFFHKDMHLIIMNSALITVQFFIFAGALIY
ncbi:hypothetical protein C0584_02085 [Candidatus Parcubacteria bacterium]|nr:MAG: hypothetical protein C0584_02085 [Candidatus Parcubacteria bacterium]